MMVRDSYGVWDQHVYTGIFKMDNQQGPTVQYSELCSVLCGSLDGRGVWDGHVHTGIFKMDNQQGLTVKKKRHI